MAFELPIRFRIQQTTSVPLYLGRDSNSPSLSSALGVLMTEEIETPRLFCRKPNEDDSRLLYSVFSDSEAMNWFGPERSLSLNETVQWIDNHEHLRSAEGFAPWVVCEKESADVIGWGGLSRDSRDQRPMNELIYILSPERWGLGLGTELARGALGYGFETLQLKDIETTVRPENTRSASILKKIGMTFLGRDSSGRDGYRVTQVEYRNQRS